MTLPGTIAAALRETLRHLDTGDLVTTTPVSGGCVNQGCRVETSTGAAFFLKWRQDAPPGMYQAEADGLEALTRAVADASGSGLRVPEVVAIAEDETWLMLEFVDGGASARRADAALGLGLAMIHGTPTHPASFGWSIDNWIGTLPQENTPAGDWATFWRDARLAPQLRLARTRGHFTVGGEARRIDAVLDRIPTALSGIDTPSLLHGDLWAGNAYVDAGGRPVLIDPAVYRGHGEVDLAMTELFGGFGPTFYDAYDDVRPIGAEYRAYRRDLYQLYYLLVHVNLFGGSYARASLRAADAVLTELG